MATAKTRGIVDVVVPIAGEYILRQTDPAEINPWFRSFSNFQQISAELVCGGDAFQNKRDKE